MWQWRDRTTPRPTGGHRREEAKVVGATTFDYPSVGAKDKPPAQLGVPTSGQLPHSRGLCHDPDSLSLQVHHRHHGCHGLDDTVPIHPGTSRRPPEQQESPTPGTSSLKGESPP